MSAIVIASKTFPGMPLCPYRRSNCGDCPENTGVIEVELLFEYSRHEWYIHVGCQNERVDAGVWELTNEGVVASFGKSWGAWHAANWDKVLDWLIDSVEENS